ncbi:hypothetical protein [Loigolactobacillus jiayinensis]|uniref:YolD-like family protein n=1 Tax=Loigolactobacillus jiayinensis TaxID=2486016 RepID=A0ABW1RBI3_9LACO|nr:hypothetical protein [Loigolactobacillus jiayinensis]
MAFNQATIKQFGTHLQSSYQKIVDFEVPTATNLSTTALPQMPQFQITQFLEQALTKQLSVTVQFNDFDHGGQTTINGRFEQRHSGTLIFRATNQKLIHLVTANAIRYIALTSAIA